MKVILIFLTIFALIYCSKKNENDISFSQNPCRIYPTQYTFIDHNDNNKLITVKSKFDKNSNVLIVRYLNKKETYEYASKKNFINEGAELPFLRWNVNTIYKDGVQKRKYICIYENEKIVKMLSLTWLNNDWELSDVYSTQNYKSMV